MTYMHQFTAGATVNDKTLFSPTGPGPIQFVTVTVVAAPTVVTFTEGATYTISIISD